MPVVSTFYFLIAFFDDFPFCSACWLPFVSAASTLQLTSIRIFLNAGSSFSSIPAVAGVSSVSTYYSLIQRWNPVLPLSPERHPYSSFNFQGSTIKSFCKYTFLYLLRFNAIISPVTANVNSTSCVLGSFLYSFLLIFCYLVL